MSSIDNVKYFASTGLVFSTRPIKRKRDFVLVLTYIRNSADSPVTDAAVGRLLKLVAKHVTPRRVGSPPKPKTPYPLRFEIAQRGIDRFEIDEDKMLAKLGLKASDLLFIDQD